MLKQTLTGKASKGKSSKRPVSDASDFEEAVRPHADNDSRLNEESFEGGSKEDINMQNTITNCETVQELRKSEVYQGYSTDIFKEAKVKVMLEDQLELDKRY